jgi:DNA-binding transcriptional LysR family regulator
MDADLDLHSIRIVRAIAETGTITGAARQLGFSQPAISQHLQRAESRQGVALVTRVGRGIRLTEAGQLLARHAVSVFSALDAASGELAELAGMNTGTARIAAFPTAASTIVPRMLAMLAHDQPGIAVSSVEAEPPEALQLLRDGAIDLAVTFRYPGDRDDPHRDRMTGLVVTPMFSEDVVLVLPESHAEATRARVDVARLADDRWIAGCPLCRGHLLAVCESAGFAPTVDHETDNALAVLQLVANGLGVALLPRLAIAMAGTPRGVVVRSLGDASIRTIHLVHHVESTRVPALAATAAAALHLDGADWGLTRSPVTRSARNH